jgi:hypothetical protein
MTWCIPCPLQYVFVVIEYIQELFLIGLMSVYRYPCTYGFFKELRQEFFIYFDRSVVMTNFPALMDTWLHLSIYWLENMYEILAWFLGFIFIYMVFQL